MNKRRKFTKQECLEDALKYSYKEEWLQKSNKFYQASRRHGWYKECVIHMKRPPHHNLKWTKEICKIKALEFESKSEWENNSSGSYNKAREKKWLEECCTHMKIIKHKNGYWDEEKCKKEALKYNSPKEWEYASGSSYNAAQKLKIYKDCISHMRKSNNKSIGELEILEYCKLLYPNSHSVKLKPVDLKFRFFEIDIYIPELKRGIEYNRSYWHSKEGLRRGRPKWNSKDIENYHHIKYDSIKSQGIKLLVITDKQWIKNKEKTKEEILNFLHQG